MSVSVSEHKSTLQCEGNLKRKMWERIVLREEIIEKVEINNKTPVLGQGRRMKWDALHKHVVDESQNYLFIIIILTNKVLFQQLQVVHFP